MRLQPMKYEVDHISLVASTVTYPRWLRFCLGLSVDLLVCLSAGLGWVLLKIWVNFHDF